MKYILFYLLCFGSACSLFAQTALNLNGADQIIINANFSSVLVKTSSAANASVQQILEVEGEDNPELRELDIRQQGNTLIIEELKPTASLIEKRYPGGYAVYNIDHEGEQYYGRYIEGADEKKMIKIKAQLIINIPADIKLKINNEFGSIRVEDIHGLKEARSQYGEVEIVLNEYQQHEIYLSSEYGAVDLSLNRKTDALLRLQTEYGEVFTDFDINIDKSASTMATFSERIIGKIGSGGATIKCSAPYGNVYVRQIK